MRTLVIGDIHGGFKALLQLLKRAKVTTEDRLIFLGDYVDGWSESATLIDFLIQLDKKQTCVFIKGNHDVWWGEWLEYQKTDNKIWYQNGGRETITSYRGASYDLAAHYTFYKKLKNYHIDDQNRLFIHAGFSSMHGPQKEVYESNYSWDRTLWEMALTMDTNIEKTASVYPQRLKLFSEIYIGHTPTIKYNRDTPMRGVNVWNIDTGAAFTGKLTALDIETKEYWQSDALPSLYPMESGRN